MKDIVIFHLAKYFPPRTMKPCDMAHPETLYEQIRSGKKTSEWRDFSIYWLQRLFDWKALDKKVAISVNDSLPLTLTNFLKVHRTWFVEGYPKGSLPRLEADITGLLYHPSSSQLEIKFTHAKELTVLIEDYMKKRKQYAGEAMEKLRQKVTTAA